MRKNDLMKTSIKAIILWGGGSTLVTVFLLLVLVVVVVVVAPFSTAFGIQQACAPSRKPGGTGVVRANVKTPATSTPGNYLAVNQKPEEKRQIATNFLADGGTKTAAPVSLRLNLGAPKDPTSSIPSNYWDSYEDAGKEYGIQKEVLAGVGKVESDHGRSPLPGVTSGQNSYGAGGPMQFIKGTWDQYGVDGDRPKDGKESRYDPQDAIFSAANYLDQLRRIYGSIREALRVYGGEKKGSYTYPDKVLSWARKYHGGNFSVEDPVVDSAACASGFNQGKWPPGSTCPNGGTLGPEHITARMRCVRDQIKAKFRHSSIGCYRADGGVQGGGEHPLGRACDFMISNGPPSPSEVKRGFDIANWAKANAKKLGIDYIIYRQHIWNPKRAGDGWRAMPDRGSLTQNHFDHVHISVLAGTMRV